MHVQVRRRNSRGGADGEEDPVENVSDRFMFGRGVLTCREGSRHVGKWLEKQRLDVCRDHDGRHAERVGKAEVGSAIVRVEMKCFTVRFEIRS